MLGWPPRVSCQNITDTYSCVTSAQTPAVTKKTSAATMQKPTTTKPLPTFNLQVSIAIKQMSTTTMKKPTATKLLPTAIEQMHTATAQAPATLASPTCKPSANQASMSQPVT
ncbi:hypothetical protein DSO57_1039163 [Entomophthora muscae]|uniref:Uncharacterized protein n=2 Tax=Entomophthora muscae TaxID=34485 RepID=A0ACC2RMG4_9FUNG|nr:hypothetical protein DSO57_1006485 [Entomophthora muscae]KAJ9079083.1 hypothetical protein DSO57_1039163 [Entomophthora muscae]